jgi:hypothetical protein
VGAPARRQAAANPHNTFSSVKRIIGRPFTAVREELRALPYAVVRAFDGSADLWCPAQCAPCGATWRRGPGRAGSPSQHACVCVHVPTPGHKSGV